MAEVAPLWDDTEEMMGDVPKWEDTTEPTWDDTQEMVAAPSPDLSLIPGMDEMADLPSQTDPQEKSLSEKAVQFGREIPGRGKAVLEGAAETASFGLGDETVAGMDAVNKKFMDVTGLQDSDQSFREMYGDSLQSRQASQEQSRKDYPSEYQSGEIAGMVAPMMTPGGAISSTVRGTGRAADTAVKGTGDFVKKGLDKGLATDTGKAMADVVGSSRVAALKKLSGKFMPETATELAAGAIGGATFGVPGAMVGVALKKAGQHYSDVPAKMAVKAADKVKGWFSGPNAVNSIEEFVKNSGGLPKGMSLSDAAKHMNFETGAVNAGTRLAGKASNYLQKYGPALKEAALRSPDALTSYVFVKQQQDPEFRAMHRELIKERQEYEDSLEPDDY